MKGAKYDTESAAFRKRFTEKLESDGWETFLEDGDIVILSRSFDDAPTPAFRAKVVLEQVAVTIKELNFLINDFKQRMDWEQGGSLHPDSKCLEQITSTRTLDVSVSNPALGGVISSREFLDLRDYEQLSDDKLIMWCASMDKVLKHTPEKGRVLGANFPCGMILEKKGDNVHVDMIWHTEVRGWLPVSVVSKAMPGQMVATCKALKERAKRKL